MLAAGIYFHQCAQEFTRERRDNGKKLKFIYHGGVTAEELRAYYDSIQSSDGRRRNENAHRLTARDMRCSQRASLLFEKVLTEREAALKGQRNCRRKHRLCDKRNAL